MSATTREVLLPALTERSQAREVEDFSQVLGGPLFQFLRKFRLEGDALELLHRRVLASILLTWLPLLLLSAIGAGSRIVAQIAFLHDIEVHARFLVALPILIGAELLVHSRIRTVVQRFLEYRVVLPQDVGRFCTAIESAKKIRNSIYVELALIAVVYTLGLWFWNSRNEVTASTWYALPGGRWRLTPAGYWYVFVSIPVFQFIL